MDNTEKLVRFACKLETDQIKMLYAQRLNCQNNIDNVKVSVHASRKYTKVNVGTSGKYMIENSTGDIYGIKAYGVIHRGYKFGNLDTIEDYFWGGYRAVKKPVI